MKITNLYTEVFAATTSRDNQVVGDLVVNLINASQNEVQLSFAFGLAYKVIEMFENSIDPSDFGFQRNVPSTADEMIIVNCKTEQGDEFEVPISILASPNVLREKIHVIRDLPKFTISKGAYPIMQYQTLLDAGVQNGTTLSIKKPTMQQH